MKLAVLAIAVLTLTGCKTALINESIRTYGDRLTIREWTRPNDATKRYYLRAQNYWIRTNIRRGLGLLWRCFEGPFMQLLNAMIIMFNMLCSAVSCRAGAQVYQVWDRLWDRNITSLNNIDKINH